MTKGKNYSYYAGEITNYQYYVEGKNEKALLSTLKSELRCIRSGKIDIFNVVQSKFTITRIRTLRPNTTVVFVYDTDTDNIAILQQNLDFLKDQTAIKEIVCVPQVTNLEDELIRSCQLRNIGELTHSNSKRNYKRDLNCCTNLGSRLKKCKFDLSKFWSCIPGNNFKVFGNDSASIKIPGPSI